MSNKIEILVLNRQDLLSMYKDQKLEDISFQSFPMILKEEYRLATFVFFKDEETKEHKVLKERYSITEVLDVIIIK